MADPFSFREVGDPAAVGSKYGSVAGHETRVIYPEQKLTRGEFRPGRVLTWKWNSDGMAAWKPRDTRLFVEYKIACGEVNETATMPHIGARTNVAQGVRPSPSLRMACLCNTALFDSGLRFIHNGVTVENVPNAYTVAMAMVLLNTNQEAVDTAASNSLVTLRKDRGVAMSAYADGLLLGQDGTRAEADASSLQQLQVVPSIRQHVASAAANGNAENQGSFMLTADAAGAGVAYTVVQAINKMRGLAANTATDLETLTLPEVSQLLVARQGASALKDTNPNPKHEILQQACAADGTMTVQTAQPVMLSSWQHPYAWPGNNSFELHATISPHGMADIFVDTSGAYGCPDGSSPGQAKLVDDIPTPQNREIGQIYVSIESVELWCSMVYPTVAPYVPRSISFKTHPFHLSSVLLNGKTINETIHVPASTRACLLFSRSRLRHHVCVDTEELSTSFAGITTSVNQVAGAVAATAASGPTQYNRVTFDSPALRVAGARDTVIDPRQVPTAAADVATANTKEQFGVESLQLTLGTSTWPRTQIADQDADNSRMAMLWHYYLDYMNKGSFSRTSLPYNYGQFCGHFNSSYQSGPKLGESGPFALATLSNPPGTLATDLRVQGTLKGNGPVSAAQQELLVVSVSDSLYNVIFADGSPTAQLTEINPIV